jgi:hypothetical protein
VRQLLPRAHVLTHDELRELAPRAAPFLAAFAADGAAGGGEGAPPPSGDAAAAAPLPSAEAQRAGRARLHAAVAFFTAYKKADPRNASEPSPVSLEFGGRFVDAPAAMAVIAQGYQHWCALVTGAMRRAQRRADGGAFARAREHAVRCKLALQQKRLRAGSGDEAARSAVAPAQPPREIWV